MVRMEIYFRELYLMNKVACEDHFSFENYILMPIAATIWLLEKIRPAIERQYIYYSLCDNWDQGLWILFFMQSIMDLFTFFNFMSSAMPIFLLRPIFVVVRLCFH